jgi:hypothetical protein
MAASSDREQRRQLTGDVNESKPPDGFSPLPGSFQSFTKKAPAVRNRPGYARVPSVSFVDARDGQQGEVLDHGTLQASSTAVGGRGLGIALPEHSLKAETIITQSVLDTGAAKDAKAIPEQSTSGLARPLMSPPSTGGLSGSTIYDSPFDVSDTSYASAKLPPKQSHVSLQSLNQPSIYANSEAGLLSVRSRYDTFVPDRHCKSVDGIRRPKLSCMPIAILTFAVYSTAMSALFLVVAFYEPRYGPMICTDCKLTIANATILTTFFAKTIELTFVTVIVAFLGQALARRAYDKRIENGITLAEINMRSWILQPGTLFTHWESVRYAGVTVLGIIALLATILAMLYVTAAQALVGPQLKSNESGNRSMQGSFPW